jgi:NTP pyrophosphatase (non-canonical NTP hydrolase)|tara:strand:- start:458 stop:1216 length:759 start_codon:yes stop_codon:yes gene_type:complete
MYYLYHIPGKKIGVTRDLNTRVTLIQGYKENEYEVLEQSDDIDYISDREIELQKSYGYKTDRKLYKNLFNKMNINATEQTSTFPVPLNKLKGHLMDNIGLQWRTYQGQFEINEQTIPWIMANAKMSMYNEERSYIYNKAYYEAFIAEPAVEDKPGNVFDDIRSWATDKGIYDKGSSGVQYLKLIEEAGELADALLKKDKAEIQDAIGDMVVVLTSIAKFEDMFIEDCIKSAYNVIAKRTGKMVNGTFVKDAN